MPLKQIIPRAYRCAFCLPFRDVLATIRVLSGRYGGGWPACAAHEQLAITRALAPLDPAHPSPIADDYVVRACRVELERESGYPMTGATLWTARRRLQHDEVEGRRAVDGL